MNIGGHHWIDPIADKAAHERLKRAVAQIVSDTKLAGAGAVVDHDPGDEDRSER